VFRAATYNVHGHVGRDGRRDPARVSTVIDELDADVVALQEFTYPVDVPLETRVPVVLTLERYECALGPARENATVCFGNAILTRHAFLDVHRIDLSITRREPRAALAATIEVRGEPVHVLVAHLGLRVPERRHQVRQILAYLESVTHTRLVVLGDFNDWMPGRTVAEVLDDRLGAQPRPRSFPAWRPLLALDRIWVQPRAALQRIRAHSTPAARMASDHLPVVAEITW
jgi:endonuclease/exonuclease/phosphatase family metal-dependent hydrolase